MEITYKKNIAGNFNLFKDDKLLTLADAICILSSFDADSVMVNQFNASIMPIKYDYIFSFQKEKNARKAVDFLNGKVLIKLLTGQDDNIRLR